MNPPFYRACRTHGVELVSRSVHPGYGPEILWCEKGHGGGHRCRSWDVIDAEGEVLAVGFMNEKPLIESEQLDGFSFEPRKPSQRCHLEHDDWYLDKDQIYHCLECERKRLKTAAKIKKVRKQRGRRKPLKAALALKEQSEQRRLERALKRLDNRRREK